MDAQKQLQERIKCSEALIKGLDLQISQKINELHNLQSRMVRDRDRLAAIRDARGQKHRIASLKRKIARAEASLKKLQENS